MAMVSNVEVSDPSPISAEVLDIEGAVIVTDDDDGDDEATLVEQSVALTTLPASASATALTLPKSANRAVKEAITIGTILARSGYFKDASEEAQAITKVLAGAELGISTFASMTGIYLVRGKLQIGAHILAALVKNSKRYRYQVRKLDREGCAIAFFEDGDEIGVSTFDLEDANIAGLVRNKAGEAWSSYVRNMFFARAMSNGVRWYCPDLTSFPVYTPGELEADDSEDITLPAPAKTGTRPVDEGELERLASGPVDDPFA